MGLKTIAAMRAELSKQAATLDKFRAAAQEFVNTHAKIQQAYDSAYKAIENVQKLRDANRGKVENLDTMGVKEFEDYKKSLIAVYSGWNDRPLPLTPLQAVIDKQRKAVDAAVSERVAKLAAAFPKEVKKGMVFKPDHGGLPREIVSDAKTSKNPNLKGDELTYFDTVDEKGSTFPLSLSELKKGFKFVKT